MRKFDRSSLAVVLAVAGAMSGCDRQDRGWEAATGPTRVCADAQGRRVSDDQCATHREGGGVSPFLWYYLGTLNRGSGVPPVGGALTGGSYRPAAGVSYAAAPASGIARGGFGATARSFGGVGGEGGAGE